MNVYVGQTRSRSLISQLSALGFGEMTNRGESLPPRREPWAFDNGAFKDWSFKVGGVRVGRPFQEAAYLRSLERVAKLSTRPDFLVVPDVVAGGLASLDFTLSWVPRVAGVAPLYLAVQDGLAEVDVDRALPGFAGIFVGGSAKWKFRTGKAWVDFAHARGLPCHIGRAGGIKSARWAQRIGADSIDSCLPLFSTENLGRFLRALAPAAQKEMGW